MSQENVEIVRAVLEAYRNPELMGQLAGGDLDLGWVDPEVEWDALRLSELIPDLAEVYWGARRGADLLGSVV